MDTNLFKISKRKLWRHKASSFTKLFSLAVGLISLFYIGLYMHREISFDNFHRNRSHIVKANTAIMSPTGDLELGLSAVPLGPYMKSVSPEVRDYVRIYKEYGSHSIRHGESLFSESETIYYADPAFLTLFDYPLLSGSRETALEGPDKLLITERAALKYFGDEEAVGKVLSYDGTPMTVSGVLANLPSNTHLQFDFLLSMDTFMKGRPDDVSDNWTWLPMNTYFLLENPDDIELLEARMKEIPDYLPENMPREKFVLSLETLENLHFSSPKLGELGPKGSIANLYLLLAIALMILFLALSNYINLTTAALAVEGKMVAVKRTLGASRKDIFLQFLTESFLVTLLAICISVVGIITTFPAFNAFMEHTLDPGVLTTPLLWLFLLFLPFLLALAGGVYPALRFSKIPAIQQRGTEYNKDRFISTRTGLIVVQFAITSGLVIGSLLIYNQLNYLRDKELGFEAGQKLVLDFGPNSEVGNAYETLKEQLTQIPGIGNATFSSHVPGQTPNGVSTLLKDDKGGTRNGEINLTLVDEDYISNYGLEIIAGRDFRQGVADSTSALIVNEAAVKAFGYTNPEEIIGASFEQWGGNGQVIGVVRDFNYLSLHQDIGLLSLKIWPQQFEKVTLELNGPDVPGTIRSLEARWTELYPEIPFKYYFVEDNFLMQYSKDRQFAGIMNMFTLISICLGVMGLVAYASFWCNRRKKEMSIKKVLGADTALLLWNLYKNFSIPVLAGFVLAVPVTYYLGSAWLSKFAYQYEINWHFFFLPMAILLVLVAISAGTQALRLVNTNPVEHLNAE